jgi:hypothetical protein
MSDTGPISPGEAGGLFAGMMAVLALLGGGAKWLLNWRERQAESRAAKLQAWHEELGRREQRLDAEEEGYRKRIEQRLGELSDWNQRLQREHAALLGGYQLLAGALRAIDPANSALELADQILAVAFPVDPVTPRPLDALCLMARRPGE